MVAETNQAYAESGVGHRVRLVERSEVAYGETGNSLVDLFRFADPSDGHMDEVHAVRDRVGADLAHLIVGRSDAGGRADILGPSASASIGAAAGSSRTSWVTTWGSCTTATKCTTARAGRGGIRPTAT